MTPQIFENLKHIVTYIGTVVKLFDEAPRDGQPLKIKPVDAIAFALHHTARHAALLDSLVMRDNIF